MSSTQYEQQLLFPLEVPYEHPSHMAKKSALRPFPLPLARYDREMVLGRDMDCCLYDDTERRALGLPPPLKLFAGVSDSSWNGWPTLAGPYVCVSPVYGQRVKRASQVALNPLARVLLDSGAFSDAFVPGSGGGSLHGKRIARLVRSRLTFGEALDRQYCHMHKYGYGSQVEALASYDVLIDERWMLDPVTGGWTRAKRRWSEQEARWAVEETIKAAAFLDRHRNGIACVMTIQGVTPPQYLSCAKRILASVRPGDLVGLGGWCATGRFPRCLLPVFRATMNVLIPFLKESGVTRLHVWGVCYAPALGELLWLCDRAGIEVSTDSAMPAVRPARGNWGYAEWTDRNYRKRQPPLHLSTKQYRRAIVDEADLVDESLWMHYLLTHDEEFAEEHLHDEQIAWMLDEEVMEHHWQDLVTAVRNGTPEVYGQVKASDGGWVPVIRAQGAYRAEHVRQVRLWLAGLHHTRWYQAPPETVW